VTGIGSSLPCLLTDCPDGMGYVAQAARDLRSRGYSVTVTNLGIPTAVLSPRLQALGRQQGRFIAGNIIEGQMPLVPPDATAVTIFAGGNDLNVLTGALGSLSGGTDPAEFIDDEVERFAEEYRALVEAIRSRAGEARIIALNLPNLAAMPFLAGEPLAHRRAAQRASVGMTTTAINPLRGESVIVIDLMCESPLYDPASLSGDGFHPNDRGYAVIASLVARALTASAYPPPQSHCAAMSAID
jgi:lysophospholipase L1-like esterase